MNLNDMIANAVLGSEAETSEDVRTVQEAPRDLPQVDLGEAEKIASALEFLGRRGIGSFLEKQAASSAACAPEGTNESQMHMPKGQKQVGPHKGAPPMQPPGPGKIPNNEDKRPGSGGSVDTSDTGKGDHHSALASNEAAINYDKKEKAKKVAPALQKLLKAAPFADPKLKENLSGAGGKGDKNIHSKTASAHDLDAIRQELASRVAGGNS
jgi:hypothetical protein